MSVKQSDKLVCLDMEHTANTLLLLEHLLLQWNLDFTEDKLEQLMLTEFHHLKLNNMEVKVGH